MSKGTIEIKGRDILINGVPTQIRSGAMHYFRIHPDYWRDRLVKLRQCGLNTVETYMSGSFLTSIPSLRVRVLSPTRMTEENFF